MNEATPIVVGLLSGAAGAIGGVWLLRTFLGAGIEHFFAVALQTRDTVGTSALEFRKLQLSEFYGPIYAYAKLNEQLYDIWMAGKLQDINLEIIAQFRRQNERIVEILATKLHLVEGDQLPPSFTHFTTSVTLWNLYTARRDQPWLPEQVAALPQAKFPKEFQEYIYATTEKLKKTLNDLHKKYGIT
jgi:hypothetical protein